MFGTQRLHLMQCVICWWASPRNHFYERSRKIALPSLMPCCPFLSWFLVPDTTKALRLVILFLKVFLAFFYGMVYLTILFTYWVQTHHKKNIWQVINTLHLKKRLKKASTWVQSLTMKQFKVKLYLPLKQTQQFKKLFIFIYFFHFISWDLQGSSIFLISFSHFSFPWRTKDDS